MRETTHESIGKVIQVLDQYRIIINAGKGSVRVGNEVQVYALGGDVLDLDGSSLGQLVQVKDTLTVTQVEEKYSICEKEETRTVKRQSLSEVALSPLFRETTIVKRVPLEISEAVEIKEPPLDRSINIGDLVRKA